MTFIIGLTGGIGCGKSTVSQLFAELGACIIDTDTIAHALTQANGPGLPDIAHVFGDDYIDQHGALDRKRMRDLIFTDPDAKTRLEAILHPLIYQAVIADIASHPNATYILLIVPLLIESQRYVNLVQRVLVVDCDEQQQISRTMMRSGLSEHAVQCIMQNQISRQHRLQHADDIIMNNHSLASTRQQIAELHQRYLIQAQILLATH